MDTQRVSLEQALESKAAVVLGNRDKATAWCATPLPALGGLTPIEYARRHGSSRVNEILTAIVHGVFV
jgi:uncharacterized protein (DUF2384 family)